MVISKEDIICIIDSLEYDTKKEEKEIIKYLFKKYGFERKDKKILADEIYTKIKKKHISFEDFWSDILNFVKPFALMLKNIYEFLNYYKSFISTRSHIFKFNLEKLNERISFDISNFPKELLETLTIEKIVKKIYKLEIDNEILHKVHEIGSADGEFCNQFSQAVSYFYYMKLKYPNYRNIEEVEDTLNKFFECLEIIIHEIIKKYRLSTRDLEIHFFYLDFENFVPEFKKENKHEAKIILFKGIVNDIDFPVDPYRLNFAKLLVQFWRRKYIRKIINTEYCWHKNQNPFKNLTKREVLSNPSLYFEGIKSIAEHYMKIFSQKVKYQEEIIKEEIVKKIIEFVKLPYWKHRWYIYELWTLIEIVNSMSSLGELRLNTYEKENCVEIKIPKANAREPIGEISTQNGIVEIWYQRKTYNPITGKGIEPDIRISLKNDDILPQDLVIIENKDRKKMQGSHVDKVIEKYIRASTAKYLFILNYESYLRNDLKNKINCKEINNKKVYVLPLFKPSNFDAISFFKYKIYETLSSVSEFKKRFQENEIHILMDISSSMSGSKMKVSKTIVKVLYNLMISSQSKVRIFTFNTDLLNEINLEGVDNQTGHGGTNLAKALETYREKYERLAVQALIVITDSDSQSIFEDLKREGIVCINLDYNNEFA